tara:strand:- start:297 stop:668 length:372 start_codon:yes stop_codon:yes gene_type:complete
MANDFKSFSKANIAIDSGTYSTLYTVPYTATDVESILLEVDIANTYSSDITVDVKINKNSGGTGGTDDIFLVKAAPVPQGGALKAISGQKIVMMSTSTGVDTITVAASVASAADCIVTVLEDV